MPRQMPNLVKHEFTVGAVIDVKHVNRVKDALPRFANQIGLTRH